VHPRVTYRQRGVSSLQRLFRTHFQDFAASYDAHYARRLGRSRLPRITRAVERFLQCGDYTKGIARILCTNPGCQAEYFRPFSCRVFQLCPSCSQKRTLLFATVCGKLDPSGQQRRQSRDRGAALAGKSTLNRLETYGAGTLENQQYKKIDYIERAVDELLVDAFLDSYRKAPHSIVLDIDPTDDELHGHQEGRFFHGYYDCYCYLPLYIYCGDHLLYAKLKIANLDRETRRCRTCSG
jgi:hypothetical protein